LSSLLQFDDDELISYEAIFATYPIISDFGTVWLPSWFLIWANMAFRDQWVTDLVPKRVIKSWHNGKPAAAKKNVINGHIAGKLYIFEMHPIVHLNPYQ
jgi:hypothetical protein